jgi:hypothetical protein
MSTAVTGHVHQCVKILNQALQTTTPSTPTHPQPMREGYEAVFELIDLPWDEGTETDPEWREGYETCLLDVVDHIAQAWGIDLPPFKKAK